MSLMEMFINKGIEATNNTKIGLNLDIVTKTNADWFLLYSGKGTGKSWATRERALKKCIEFKDELLIVKRLEVDCKSAQIRKYFDNVDVLSLTNGEYNSIEVRGSEIFFANLDEKFKSHRGIRIGHTIPLSAFERYKGTDYPLVTTIIFEEFISENNAYLSNESSTLMKLINTIYRPQTLAEYSILSDDKKERIKRREVFLCGNTISRHCVYFNDWYLKNIIHQQPNTIDIYTYRYPDDIDEFTNKPREIKLACWYIGENKQGSKKSHSFVFGKAYDTIVKGDWECDIYPRLERDYNEYDKIFEILIKHQNTNYILQLLYCNNEYTLYVYPSTSPRNIQRVISTEYSTSFYVTNRLMKDRKIEKFIGQLLILNKIAYSDNLTGTEFTNIKEKLLVGM